MNLNEATPSDVPVEPLPTEPLTILYQDEHYVAVDKPAGLLVHRAKQTPLDEPVLLQQLRDQIGTFLYPAHRLDRPTSGLIVFGLTSEAAAKLVNLFTKRQVQKKYQALVRGYFPESVRVDLKLRDRFGEEQPGYDESCHPEQDAVTRFGLKENFEMPWECQGFSTSRYSLVEAMPETGRWHQIRRHLHHISHPIIGDHRHGDNHHNHAFEERLGLKRMLLVATELELQHPFTGELLCIRATLGREFESILSELRHGNAG